MGWKFQDICLKGFEVMIKNVVKNRLVRDWFRYVSNYVTVILTTWKFQITII